MIDDHPSYDPADFDPSDDTKRYEPKLCHRCGRVFINRWVFLRHRREGRGAITEPVDPNVPCYSDRQLRRRGMWKANGIWMDKGDVSPLDEDPGTTRRRGKGRQLPKGHRYSARHQAKNRRSKK